MASEQLHLQQDGNMLCGFPEGNLRNSEDEWLTTPPKNMDGSCQGKDDERKSIQQYVESNSQDTKYKDKARI